MSGDLSLLHSLKKVFRMVTGGSGVSQAVVREMRSKDARGKEAARELLLGYPLQTALEGLRTGSSDEISILSTLLVGSTKSSSELVGENAEELSFILERWMKAKENVKLEERVVRFRSLIASSVLGAVMGMVSSVGPLVGSLNFASISERHGSGDVIVAAFIMTCIGSLMLGLFTSRKKLILNLAASVVAFVVVTTLASPLSSVGSAGLWGIK